MVSITVVTRAALLIARRASTWTVDEHLGGRSPDCVAVDPRDPTRVYCGTAGAGLFRSHDRGRTWEPVGPGIEHGTIKAVAVSPAAGLTGSAPSMPAPNQVRCFAPTLAATAGWTSPACARSLRLTPGVFPHGRTRIMFGGSKPM